MVTTDFITKLSSGDHSKTESEKFRDFCEMAYCALAKLTADSERGEALEARYMQIVGQYEDKDIRVSKGPRQLEWRCRG